jgi:glycosyltransferase 2 family protein
LKSRLHSSAIWFEWVTGNPTVGNGNPFKTIYAVIREFNLPNNYKFKSIFAHGLKILSAALIIGFLLYFKFIDLAVLGRILKQPAAVIMAATLIFASYVSGTSRWLQILRAQGFNIAFFRLFNISTASIFSSFFLPGGTGSSDGVRAMLILRAVPSGQGRAMLTVIFDRFCELLTLSIMTATFGVLSWREASLPIYWLRTAAVVLPFLLLGGALVAYALTLHLRNSPWTKKSEGRGIWRAISAASGFIELIALNPRRVLTALFLSGVNRALVIGAVIVVAVASEAPHLTLAALGEASALSMFANGVPITPGGIGVGEAVFNQICTWLADPPVDYPYGTIFLAYRVISMITACYGLIPLVNVGQSLYERRR